MLRSFGSIGLALIVLFGAACNAGPQPDPPVDRDRDAGGGFFDAGSRRDSGIAGGGGDSGPMARDDSGPPGSVDAAPGDAGEDAPDGGVPGDAGLDLDATIPLDGALPGDAGPSACMVYCDCMFERCLTGDGRSRLMCLADCETLTTEQRECRSYHCTLAPLPRDDSSVHCLHAQGMGGLCE